MLGMQLPLAIMECVSEDTANVELFWRLFNRAYREANQIDEKFMPFGWVTDMATVNIAGLAKIYGDDIIDKIKGCEFHYLKSANEKASTTSEKCDEFTPLAHQLLEASTKEGYNNAYNNLHDFVNVNCNLLKAWLKWWDNRKELIFRAFKPMNAPRMNQAEVIHASWELRNVVGLTLMESTEFDVRNFLLTEELMQRIPLTKTNPGQGISLGEMRERNAQMEEDVSRRKGEEFIRCNNNFLNQLNIKHCVKTTTIG